MINYAKPLPGPTAEQKPFWNYCKAHELRMQKCHRCGNIRYPISFICPKCQSVDPAEWVKLSGKGTVYSFTNVNYVYHKAFASEIPYVIAVIALEEGPRILSNIIKWKKEDLKIGMPVEVEFEDVTDQFALPKFKPLV